MRSKLSSNVSEIELNWLSLFDSFFGQPPVRGRIAAPFLSVPPADYDPIAVPSILYVGKATAGNWWRRSFLRSPTVKERHQCTADFLEDWVKTGKYSTAFWRFALALSKRLAVATHSTIQPLQNLVWTNICKIGVLRGNPTGKILRMQSEQAVAGLRTEIKMYRPRLVVFVTGDYAAQLVDAVVGDCEQKTWHKERGADLFWWREATGNMPAILWACHPERKPVSILEGWLEQATRLVRMTA
jgi:hypothetical protein